MVEDKYDCVFVLLFSLNCKILLHVVNFLQNYLIKFTPRFSLGLINLPQTDEMLNLF